MKKRMSILVSAVMGVIATQADIRWSGSGLVGREGKTMTRFELVEDAR